MELRDRTWNFYAANSVDEALAAAQGGAAFVAGGTNLVPDVLFGRKKIACAVDISRLDELRFIEEAEGKIRIGRWRLSRICWNLN